MHDCSLLSPPPKASIQLFWFWRTCRMFTDSCRRLRIMKGSDVIGLGMLKPLSSLMLIHTYSYGTQ
jgi:hypothetical protein